MRYLSTITSLFTLLLLTVTGPHIAAQVNADTSAINTLTRDAYLIARTNPDRSIRMGHQALSIARSINYSLGMADASLALGMAYLAKYNINDSALVYNNQALTAYEQINDIHGQALARYALSYVFSFKGHIEESENQCRQSLSLFELSGDSRGMINAYSALTYLARQRGDLDSAHGLIQQAIDIARSANDTVPLADAINSLGNIYKEMALLNQAIDSYFEALRLWGLKGDSAGLSIAYGSIGLAYYFQKNYNRALLFNFRKLAITEASGNLWESGKTLNNISQIYNAKNQYDSSLFYIRRGLDFNRRMNYPSGIAAACYNMANTFLLISETDSSLLYITKAVDLARELKDPALVDYLVTLGHVKRVIGASEEALRIGKEAYTLAKEQGAPMAISNSSSLMNDLYRDIGRKDLAYDFLNEFYLIRDSISNNELLNQITRLDIQYVYDQKQKAADLSRMHEALLHESKIRQQGLYLRGLLILLILLAIITFLYLRHSTVLARYSRMDLEQRLLRAQMNPHFIFNSLCAIQELILAGKNDRANLFLGKIASLMRNILEQTTEEFIPLYKELETLKLYMEVQQLRFETKFICQFIIDEAIDPNTLSVPPMLAQPCIENSIEHGLKTLEKAGHIIISYTLSGKLLRLEITDNGVGRAKAVTRMNPERSKGSISTRLTKKRLEHFRKMLGEKNITYSITDLYQDDEPAGTKTVMLFPYRRII